MTAAPTREVGQRPLRRALTALCLTQVVSWGVLYYAFPVALASITADTGWSPTSTTAAFSASLIASAIAGIPTGRLIDRLGPRAVMTTGSVLVVPAVVMIALAPNMWLFFVGWIWAGIAQSAVLYQAAFAAITGWYGPHRVRALTTLTLIAGLASTIFAPLTSYLLHHFDWRTTYLVLAAVLAVVTIPAHLFLLTPPWHPGHQAASTPRATIPAAELRRIIRSRTFLVLSGVLTVAEFGVYAASLTLIPLLTGRGFSTGLAAITLGLVGAGQLLGRIAYAPLTAHTTPTTSMVVILGSCAGTLALLALIPGPAALLILIAVLLGAARGAATLLQATIVADVWGTTHYATLAGYFAAPITLATAVAPWAGIAIGSAIGSYPVMLAILAVLIASATVAAALHTRPRLGPRATHRT